MKYKQVDIDKIAPTLQNVLGDVTMEMEFDGSNFTVLKITSPRGHVKISGGPYTNDLQVRVPVTAKKHRVSWEVMGVPATQEFAKRDDADRLVEDLSEKYSITATIEDFETTED